MPRLILLLAIAAVVYLLLRRVKSLPPHRRRAEYIKIGIGVLVVAVIGLTLTGRMHWIGAAFTALLVGARQLLPLAIRFFPMLASLRGKNAAASGAHSSTVDSEVLRMHLDHDSGELQGEVLKGHYTGWRLQDMDREQLETLLSFCQQQDQDSVQLLDSYLQQRFPGEGPFGAQSSTASQGSGQMNRAEALAVLGLDESATEEDIVQAHRRLMQKLHPDRGGNDYLASRVNQAKDTLLG
ncbi:MAG: DnaJ domain-containing protein [Halioglobus sp.]